MTDRAAVAAAVTLEIGAGDGRYALSRALAHPDRLVIAIDASRAAMVEGSRRAARRGIANALFVVCAAEVLPAELCGIAGELAIHFPWGSLLRAVAGDAPRVTGNLARLVARGGHVRLLVASSPRDAHAGAAALDLQRMVAAWEEHGLRLTSLHPATLEDAIAAHSSWGKRLLRNPDPGRSAWQIELERWEPGRPTSEAVPLTTGEFRTRRGI